MLNRYRGVNPYRGFESLPLRDNRDAARATRDGVFEEHLGFHAEVFAFSGTRDASRVVA